MSYLIIGAVVLLAVGLWVRWANKVDQKIQSGDMVAEARARAEARKSSRAFKDTDWDVETSNIPDVHHLTPSETVVVDLLLNDFQETQPARPEADLYTIDLDKELKRT